jgi:AraC family transcriptional regulator
MEIHVVDLEPMRLAAVSHRGDYGKIGEAFGLLDVWAKQQRLEHAPLVAVYYDDPHSVSEPELRSEAGVIVHGDTEISGEGVHEVQVPGGRYAMGTYVGDYSGLPKAWEDFYVTGIMKAGLKTKPDACFERYVMTTADVAPEELITELYAPLA